MKRWMRGMSDRLGLERKPTKPILGVFHRILYILENQAYEIPGHFGKECQTIGC